MSEAVNEDYAGSTAQEDFRSFLDEQEQEWGDDGLEEGVLDGLEEEEETYEEPAPDAPLSQARREGTDDVVRRLRQSDPEAARVVSGMQRKMHQNINEWNQLRSEVLGLREQLIAQREGNVNGEATQEEVEAQLPEGVTDQHLDMFRSMADHLGYVPRTELEGREADARAQRYVNDNLAQAYETYGDSFGEQDENGNVRIHPEVQQRLNKRLAELQDPNKGITPLDLYRLEFGDEPPVEQAPARPARRQARQQPQQRRPSPSATVRRSSRGTAPVRIYDPRRGDSAEDVFDRAWALGKRQLTGQ